MVSCQVLPRAARTALILSGFLWSSAQAMTAPMSDAELVRGSSVVVDAQVRRLTPHWDENHSLIFTTVELDVSRTLYSRDPFTEHALKIEVLGGELDGVGLLSPDAPTFRVDERVVVFARPWSAGRLVVAGGQNGVLRVDASGRVQGRDVGVDQLGSQLRDLAGKRP